MFTIEDWRSSFIQYLKKGVLSQKHNERYKLRKLATRYFLHKGIIVKKGYDRDPLWCFGPKEAREMLKEVHAGEYEEHQGKKSYIGAYCK